MQKAIFLSLTIAAVALAGCTGEPQSGSFLATVGTADYSEAQVTITSQSSEVNYPVDNPQDEGQVCTLDAIFSNVDGAPFSCQDATSTVSFTEGGASLPQVPDSPGYELILIRVDGAEFSLGSLEHHGEGHYGYPTTEFPGEDFSFSDEVQLRFGATTVARAGGSGGTLELIEGLASLTADVAFDGADITVILNGAPGNAPLIAWLIDIPEEEDEEGNMVKGAPVHAVQFLLGGNETAYTLTEEEGFVGDYEEFHVHVGNSAINVLKVQIPTTLE